MTGHSGLAWMLVMLGLMTAGAGLAILLAPAAPWVGRLPGDLILERGTVRVHFPLMTCILASVVLTVLAWAVRHVWHP